MELLCNKERILWDGRLIYHSAAAFVRGSTLNTSPLYSDAQAVFINNATFGTADTAAAPTASTKTKTKKMTDFFGGASKKAPPEVAPSPAAAPADLKGRVVRTEFDLEGTKHSGEGRTIMIELDSFFLVACYVPNSGQNLERLDYRVDEWYGLFHTCTKLLFLLMALLSVSGSLT